MPVFQQFFEALTALLPFFITGFGVYIAAQQLHTNKKRLKVDLFEKRWKVYSAITDYIGAIIAKRINQDTHHSEYQSQLK